MAGGVVADYADRQDAGAEVGEVEDGVGCAGLGRDRCGDGEG